MFFERKIMIKRKEKKGLGFHGGGRKYKGEMTTEEELTVYWQRRKKNLKDPMHLVEIVEMVDHFPTRKRALIEFLARENLSFNHHYRMFDAAKDILKESKRIKTRFWKSFFRVCTIDHLVELNEENIPEAIKEFYRRIDSRKYYTNQQSLQALIRSFEKRTDPKIRKSLWGRIKSFDPGKEDLKYILNLPMMYSLPKIAAEIEKMLQKKSENKREIRTIRKIKELVAQIEQEQKQGQE